MATIRKNFVDGCAVEIQGGVWDLTLPSGVHIRGSANDDDAALAALNARHDQYVLEQWAKGTMIAKQSFLVPLT